MLKKCLSFITLLILMHSVFCEECTLHYNPVTENKQLLLNKISLLKNQKFVLTARGFTYAVTICGSVSSNHPIAAATKSFNTDKNTTVIGRLNDTHIVGGDDWVLLTFASGDKINSDYCHNTTSTSIMITCNKDSAETIALSDDDIKNDCKVTFHLKTAVVCPNIPPGLSTGSVFCILIFTGGLMYLMVGIAYRRIMAGAQGLEQIPHYQFWRDLGNLQADGCDLVCRKGAGRDESWNRITSNFNDPADEPLLHP